MCMQAWRCAVVAVIVDGIIDIYLIGGTPEVMHVYPEDDMGTPARVIWVLVLVSFLLHTAGCAWVIHNVSAPAAVPSVFWRCHHFRRGYVGMKILHQYSIRAGGLPDPEAQQLSCGVRGFKRRCGPAGSPGCCSENCWSQYCAHGCTWRCAMAT
jgi:hypothetical protein